MSLSSSGSLTSPSSLTALRTTYHCGCCSITHQLRAQKLRRAVPEFGMDTAGDAKQIRDAAQLIGPEMLGVVEDVEVVVRELISLLKFVRLDVFLHQVDQPAELVGVVML